jgi:hypothetical protein
MTCGPSEGWKCYPSEFDAYAFQSGLAPVTFKSDYQAMLVKINLKGC